MDLTEENAGKMERLVGETVRATFKNPDHWYFDVKDRLGYAEGGFYLEGMDWPLDPSTLKEVSSTNGYAGGKVPTLLFEVGMEEEEFSEFMGKLGKWMREIEERGERI